MLLSWCMQFNHWMQEHAPTWQLSWHAGALNIANSDRYRKYFVQSFVVQSRRSFDPALIEASKKGNLEAFTSDEFLEKVQQRLVRSFYDRIAISTPDCRASVNIHIPDIEILATRPVPIDARRTIYALAADVSFVANITLSGPWYIGRLSNKGFGSVRYAKS